MDHLLFLFYKINVVSRAHCSTKASRSVAVLELDTDSVSSIVIYFTCLSCEHSAETVSRPCFLGNEDSVEVCMLVAGEECDTHAVSHLTKRESLLVFVICISIFSALLKYFCTFCSSFSGSLKVNLHGITMPPCAK